MIFEKNVIPVKKVLPVSFFYVTIMIVNAGGTV